MVDFYWVGEFTKAGWLQPLDDRIEADKFDTSVYVPKLMDLVGKVDGATYMLPFYNYAMGLLYRTDLLADEKNKADFKAKYGMELRVPKTWDEYLKQVEFFTKDGMYGVVNQGLRPDPIAMEWSNYLFANGGEYHDANWKPTLNTEAGVKALEQYATNINKYGPLGAASFCFDEAFNVMAQGKAYSYITYNFFRAAHRRSVEVAGRRQGRDHAGARHRGRQGRQPQRRLGLGHPEIEPQSRRGLDVPQVGRSRRRSPRSARCRAARRPAPTSSTIPR